MDSHETVEDELIFGALRRERQWKIAAASMALMAACSMAVAGAVTLYHQPSPPVLVPYDPATGVAIPNASVKAVTLTEKRAVVEAAIYRYVKDRETYNQIDNDVRINRALKQSSNRALASLNRSWDSRGDAYIPARYGDRAEIEVNILSISQITNDRAQVRLVKRLINQSGVSEGAFTVVLGYAFRPEQEKSLEDLWDNPFGFTVTDYNITADKRDF